MDSTLIWNIRGVGSAGSRRSLRQMVFKMRPLIVAISEPKIDFSRASSLARLLQLDQYAGNDGESSKIWVF